MIIIIIINSNFQDLIIIINSNFLNFQYPSPIYKNSTFK